MVRKVRKQKTKATAVILSILFIFMCMYGIKANAMDVTSQTYEGTTYTGSITYYGVSGPSGYYELVLRASIMPKELNEYVRLKSGSGADKPAISAMTRNSRTASAQTPTFVGNDYTTYGFYYYSVTSSTGNTYSFSVTR